MENNVIRKLAFTLRLSPRKFFEINHIEFDPNAKFVRLTKKHFDVCYNKSMGIMCVTCNEEDLGKTIKSLNKFFILHNIKYKDKLCRYRILAHDTMFEDDNQAKEFNFVKIDTHCYAYNPEYKKFGKKSVTKPDTDKVKNDTVDLDTFIKSRIIKKNKK